MAMHYRKAMALLLMVLLVCTACGANTNDGNGSGTSPGGAASGGESDELPEVEITYWTDPRFKLIEGMEEQTPNNGDFEKWQAEQFMAQYPHVKIDVQVVTFEDMPKKVPASIAAGTQPDILRDYLGRTSQYAYQGVLENLEESVSEEELADYHQDYLDMYTIDGHLHALPAYAWTATMMLNREMWAERDALDLLPTREDPYWTIEEFDTAIRAVAEPGKVFPYAVHISNSQSDNGILELFWGFGAKLYADGDYSKIALNSPEGAAAMEYLVQLNKDGLLPPSISTTGPTDINNLIWSGQVGAYVDTLYAKTKLADARAEGKTLGEPELLFVSHPSAAGVTSGVPVGPTGYAVFKQDDDYKREWVVKFVEFLNSTEYQEMYAINAGQFPVKKSAGVPLSDDPDFVVMQQLIEERGLEDMGLTSPKYAEVRELLYPEVQAALLGMKTPEQALADYEKAANRVLAQ
ncbi:extracellular solute-binding protein [Paenibacillus sp. IB182496]|uniref:Extracellular solute-binding protein n=1 Tax=Paenibacillus sabuli TaxID=2772509 RepID=A0A927GT20_9BACL|nr:extracellular solute-binding protein [Paenibacillus sabuli]MBD2846630.1 extracellular solute-binding protein [Paenibacillus sabuli]